MVSKGEGIMAEEGGPGGEQQTRREEGTRVDRKFTQPADAISFYCDNIQAMGTGEEVVLQLYELIPGPPEGPEGTIKHAESRLRATVKLSKAHAKRIGKVLLEQAE